MCVECGAEYQTVGTPPSQRSLVGMTQGARKRAARCEAYREAVTYGREVLTPQLRRLLVSQRTLLMVERTAAEYTKRRTKYRLGERLRPCLVCQWAKCKLPCRDCSTCDGSGVLPAKRAPQKKCPGCPDCVTRMQDREIAGVRVQGEVVLHREGCSHDDPSGWCCFAETITVTGECGGSGWLMGRGRQ